MAWSDAPTALTALRDLILDGPTHKLCSNKKVIGVIDGVNTIFKTFEYRRVTALNVVNSFPLGAYKNGALIAAASVSQDDVGSGTFQLVTPPSQTARDVITATYYYQWFTDAELTVYMQNAATWLGFASANFFAIPDGLNASALRFAAQEAYLAAAMKYSTRASEAYKLEDAPNEDILKSVAAFQSMAKDFMESATELRDDYYTRQGQSQAPNFGFALGCVVDPTPRR